MKKIYIVTLLFTLMTLSSCNISSAEKKDKNNVDVNKSASIMDYFPFTENYKYTYEGVGNEYASYSVFIDYIKDNRMQTRTNNGGTETVKILEYKDGELKEIFSRGETYFRENFTAAKNDGGEILLKEPLAKGTSWTTGNNIKKSITNVDVEITTPLGSFKSLEVTSEGNDNKTVNYYAKDMGLIKTVYTGNGYEVSSTLGKIEKDVPLVQRVKVFFPNINNDKLNFIEMDISFKTNEEPKDIIEKSIRDIGEKKMVLSKNAKINSIKFNDSKQMVEIDFSKELVTEMNAGSLYESMILQSITNTLGGYYGVDKVYITVESKPYESGHIMKNEGEPFLVNLDNVENPE